MERKQFNVKDFVSNEETPVETRGGIKVRILCTDRKGSEYSIIGLVLHNHGYEAVFEFTEDGRLWRNGEEDEDDLLFTTC